MNNIQSQSELKESFLLKLKNAYETHNPNGLFNLLSEDVTYESMWVLDQIKGKADYENYLTHKLQVQAEHHTKFNFIMMYQGGSVPVLMFTPKSPDGDYGAFTVEINAKGEVKAIHLMAASLLYPLVYKDKEEFEKFLKNAGDK